MISFFLVEIKLNPPRTPTAVRATSAEIMTIAEEPRRRRRRRIIRKRKKTRKRKRK